MLKQGIEQLKYKRSDAPELEFLSVVPSMNGQLMMQLKDINLCAKYLIVAVSL